MASEELFTPELSAVIENEQIETEEKADDLEAENIDLIAEDKEIITETEVEETIEVPEADGGEEKVGTTSETGGQEARLFQLPFARIRNLMKLDPDLHIASNEAVFVITRSTELFIESLAREAFSYTTQSKKKTMQKRDVDLAISSVDSLMFLDGAMNF